MNRKVLTRSRRVGVNRRAFLYGSAGAAVALPFLESLPERSAWAASENPTFALLMCAANGVIQPDFFPPTGALTEETLTDAGKATSELARHAAHLLLLSGVNRVSALTSDPHIDGFCDALTATQRLGSGASAMGGGASADTVIASMVHPDLEPLTLYAGNLRNGYTAERLSYTAPGEVRSAVDNPYQLYLELVGLAGPGGTMTPEAELAAQRLIRSRNSIHDLVREDLTDLMQHPRLSSWDRQRLQQHFDAIRDAEEDMLDPDGMGCTTTGLDLAEIEALEEFQYDPVTTTELCARLHMSLVAMAFACNHRRVATLQWGDCVDNTRYDVPANEMLGAWPFIFISHQTQSAAAVDTNPTAEQAHREIDAVRMRTLAAGLDHFKARGLEDRSLVMWTNAYGDARTHSSRNVPHLVWGSGGNMLKQAEHIQAPNVGVNRLLNTLITATVQETNTVVDDFGEGEGGLLEEILA